MINKRTKRPWKEPKKKMTPSHWPIRRPYSSTVIYLLKLACTSIPWGMKKNVRCDIFTAILEGGKESDSMGEGIWSVCVSNTNLPYLGRTFRFCAGLRRNESMQTLNWFCGDAWTNHIYTLRHRRIEEKDWKQKAIKGQEKHSSKSLEESRSIFDF